ncbi:NAD-dependent epimerase/dehydratase family protein [Candidatus Pacearchaeota archaeon]|nr:NAD-dependent epimerase/dehydratase family protein [Candidatus Pacearchaeota archaeon]
MLKNKNIAVTGGAGFLGTCVVNELVKCGADMKKIYVPRSKDYDLRDENAVERMLDDSKADILFHLAANTGGADYYKAHPAAIYHDNLKMGINLLEAARKRKLEKIVIIGTGLAYPRTAAIPYQERSIFDGYPEETAAPYGLSSRALLEYSMYLRKEYGIDSIYLIPANLYGPGDHYSLEIGHVIPATIVRLSEAIKNNDEEIIMRGSNNSREFLYVEDAARAIVAAAGKYNSPLPLNIGTGKSILLKEVMEELIRLMKFRGRIKWEGSGEGASRRCFDVTRMKQELGFEPKTEIKEGLRKTVEDYLKKHG